MFSSSEKKMRRALKSLLLTLPLGAALLSPGIAQADQAGDGAVLTMAQEGRWVVMAGTSLKDTLEGWTRVSGWTLIWDSPVDYRMRASATFRGSFEESGSKLIDSIYEHNPELAATFHRGNRVLHIANKPLTSH